MLIASFAFSQLFMGNGGVISCPASSVRNTSELRQETGEVTKSAEAGWYRPVCGVLAGLRICVCLKKSTCRQGGGRNACCFCVKIACNRIDIINLLILKIKVKLFEKKPNWAVLCNHAGLRYLFKTFPQCYPQKMGITFVGCSGRFVSALCKHLAGIK